MNIYKFGVMVIGYKPRTITNTSARLEGKYRLRGRCRYPHVRVMFFVGEVLGSVTVINLVKMESLVTQNSCDTQQQQKQNHNYQIGIWRHIFLKYLKAQKSNLHINTEIKLRQVLIT